MGPDMGSGALQKTPRDSNSENYAWNCKQVYILFIHESE